MATLAHHDVLDGASLAARIRPGLDALVVGRPPGARGHRALKEGTIGEMMRLSNERITV